MTLPNGQHLNNRYRIDKIIGQGGYGTVYRAFDTILHHTCAIKESVATDPQTQRQFEREALILAGVRHASLPRVFDHFTMPDQGQYLVMDFVEGESLYHILVAEGGVIAEETALHWMDQVCRALDNLHCQSPPIIHRDIKPQNIIITPTGRAILVDFGLSKIYDEHVKTTSGAQGVTFGYAPPEQYGQGRTDARSDVYALGATLYTLLTGQRPPDAIQRIMHDVPLIPPRQLNPQISSHVEQAILKALETDTQQRYHSAEAFRVALYRTRSTTRPITPHLHDTVELPTTTPPQPKPTPASLLNWRLVGMGLIVLIIFGGLLVFFTSNSPQPTATRNQTATPLAWSTSLPTLTPTTEQATVERSRPNNLETTLPTPTRPPPYELRTIRKESGPFTRFSGTITDAEGQPVDGVFVRAHCSDYSTISYPSGPVGWGLLNEGAGWPPGYYDITVDNRPVPCLWFLTVVDTENRQTITAELSPPVAVEVTETESVIQVNWRKNW